MVEQKNVLAVKAILTNKESILMISDLPIDPVYIAEWKSNVYVRGLTAFERDQFESTLFTGEGKTRKQNFSNMRARLLVLTICDEKGNRLFSDTDADILGKKSAKALNKLFAKAQELSGIGEKDVEELIKNSESIPQD